MKIVVVDSTCSARVYDHFFCQGLADIGHEVTLFGRPKRGPEEITGGYEYNEFFFRKGELLRRKGWPRRAYQFFKGFEYLFNAGKFMGLMKKIRPDIVHFQWLLIPHVNRWMIKRLRRFTGVVCTVHDTKYYRGGQVPRVMMWGRSSAYNSCDLVLVHTTDGRDRLEADGVSTELIRLFPHGMLDHRDLGNVENRDSGTEEYMVILFFGTLWKFKEIDVLIKAYAAMQASIRSKTRLWIVGKPIRLAVAPLKRLAVELGVDSQIHWRLQYLPDHEVEAVQRRADIFVFPFHSLDVSRAMMASFQYGKPLVATDSGGFADYIEDGVSGFLFPAGDYLGLSRALERIVTNPDLAARMGSEVLKVSERIASWKEIAGKAQELYLEVLERKD